MDYSKVAYKLHTLSLNRKQTVDATRQVLDASIHDLNTKTYGIFNQHNLDSFLEDYPNFKIDTGNATKPLKYPEVGLWASNYVAIKEFLNYDYEYLLLVEDDVKVKDNFYTKMDEYFNEMPSNMECFLVFKPENIFYIAGYEALENESQYHTDSSKIWKAHQTWSTGAILLNRAGANKFIDYIESGIKGAMDIFLFGSDKTLNVYSPAKLEEPMAELHLYSTLIQSGKEIEV